MLVNAVTTKPSVEQPTTKILTVHQDLRGNLRETWRASWGLCPPIVQLVRSWSRQGVVRGMHYHKEQTDVWHFVEGEALVQLYDHRTGWYKQFVSDHSETIVIPPGIAHGFQAITDVILMYGFDIEYNSEAPDEYGFSPLDLDYPGAQKWMGTGIDRVAPDVILSDRDKYAPPLKLFREKMG
jgi:dTDP-4-dehydrorhamnose 3,5-epimerase